jgi:hypothetical protein
MLLVFILIVTCQIGVAADQLADEQLRHRVSCRNYTELAVRCGKIAPSMELPIKDINYLCVLETCCVIRAENVHILGNPAKRPLYVPDFCDDIGSVVEGNEERLNHQIWRLSQADDKDNGKESWQRTWRTQYGLLQQSCNPMAMHLVMKETVDLLQKHEPVVEFFNTLSAPFRLTMEWKRQDGKRDAIKMIQEVMFKIPGVQAIFSGVSIVSVVLLALMAIVLAIRVFIRRQRQPAWAEVMTSAMLAGITWFLDVGSVQKVLATLVASALLLLWIGSHWVNRLEEAADDQPAVSSGASKPLSALELIQTLLYSSMKDPQVLGLSQHYVEYALSSAAGKSGTLAYYYDQAVTSVTARNGLGRPPNHAMQLAMQYRHAMNEFLGIGSNAN